LEPGLGGHHVRGLFPSAEACLGRLVQRPQAEAFDALDLLGVEVVVGFFFEGQAEHVPVEPARLLDVRRDRSETRHEQDLHQPLLTARAISRFASRSAIASRLSYCLLPRAHPISNLAWLREKYTRRSLRV